MLVDGELKGSYTNVYSYFFTEDQSDRVSIATDKDKSEPGIYIGDQRLNVAIPPSSLAYSFSKDGKKVAFVKDENGEVWRRILTLR
jgi:Tol biopolymer transport system component